MQLLTEPENQSLSWHAAGEFLRRYRWMILLVWLITLACGWLTLQVFFNDLFETRASILVKVGRETSEMPTTMINGHLLSQGVRIQDINSEVQLLSSRDLIERVVDRIGPENFRNVLVEPTTAWGYPKYWLKSGARWAKGVYTEGVIALNLKKRLGFREEVILAVGKAVKVEPVKDSDVLVLKVRLASQQLAVDTASGLIEEYLKRRAEVRNHAGGYNFFEAEANQLQSKLSEFTARKAEVRNRWDVSSATEQRSLLLKQLASLETDRLEVEARINAVEQEHRKMSERLSRIPATLPTEQLHSRNPALQSIKERITNLQMERARTLGKYQADSELIRNLDGEIESLREALTTEEATILASTTSQTNPLREEFEKGIEQREIELAGLRARLYKIEQPIRALGVRLNRLNHGGDRMESAERELRLIEEEYIASSRRREEARIAEQLNAHLMANVSLIAPPEFPFEPVSPRKLFIMGILIPIGLVLGAGIAVLTESLDDRIRVETDIAALQGVTFLGSVRPMLEGARKVS